MSENICVTVKKAYGPPCFLDGDDRPNCEYTVTECGMSLIGIPKNAETERFFKAASITGSVDILSDDDIKRQVTEEVHGFFKPSESSEEKNAIIEGAARFKKDATEFLNKLRQK